MTVHESATPDATPDVGYRHTVWTEEHAAYKEWLDGYLATAKKQRVQAAVQLVATDEFINRAIGQIPDRTQEAS